MVSVASLLNPVKDEQQQLPSPCSTRDTPSSTASTPRLPLVPPQKKQKVSKDAAIFMKGKIQGEVRYPPWEKHDSSLAEELRKWSIFPLGTIAMYRRHIPYNSDKKDFLAKTGRGAFEGKLLCSQEMENHERANRNLVFQYTFKAPEDDKNYTVMWDYNIGLVRITPFFKCCGYAKTVPAKMLNSNPGLREICHSITGGALAAQGYWMPFEAAKAITATFCWDIRYALIPLFGPSFPTLCVKRGDEGYGRMVIDSATIKSCADECREYRTMASREAHVGSSSCGLLHDPMLPWPKPVGIYENSSLQHQQLHYVDSEMEGPHLPSPRSTLGQSPKHRSRLNDGKLLPSPRDILSNCPSEVGRFTASPESPCSSSGGGLSPNTRKRKPVTDGTVVEGQMEYKEKISPTFTSIYDQHEQHSTERSAAYLLMKLHFADTSLKDPDPPSRKRRASN